MTEKKKQKAKKYVQMDERKELFDAKSPIHNKISIPGVKVSNNKIKRQKGKTLAIFFWFLFHPLHCCLFSYEHLFDFDKYCCCHPLRCMSRDK